MTFPHTKIQPPRTRAGYVQRGVLQSRLADALLARRVVLLCAPAGYGKTTLLAHELSQLPAGHAVGWVSADAGDDLSRLLECMLAALEPYDPPWRAAPEALVKRVGASDNEERSVAAELINALDACEVEHGVIAFDDLHRVDDPAFFRFLDVLLERLSLRWTIAITTRDDPPLALARLRGRGELAEFRQLQLQFARSEARELASHAGVDAAAADRLFDRTLGWPAALRIAIGAMQSGADPNVRALRSSERPLFEFFVTEVLEQLPPALADFVLAASVLPELDAARCTAVTGDPGAAARLLQLERLGLCVDEIDAPTHTLRLHDLVRDALLARLQESEPQRLAQLRRRAAATEPDPVRRIGWLLQAGDLDDAARELLAAAPGLNLRGAPGTVLRLCEAFPPAFSATNAELQRVLGLAKQTLWQLQDAERHYAAAQALYRERDDAAAEQLAIARRAAVLAALGRLTQASDLLSALPATLHDGEAQMVASTALLWLALESCEFDQATEHFGALLRLQLVSDRLEDWQTIPPPRLTASRRAAPLVAQWASAALQVAGEQPVPLRALALIALGWCAAWQARPEEAAELLKRAEADAYWVGEEVIARSHGLALRAVVALVQSDHGAAMQAMRSRVAEQPTGYGGWGLWHALFLAVRVAAACNQTESARVWLTQLLALHPTLPEVTPQRLLPALGLQGTLASLEGRPEDARGHWEAALAHESTCDLMSQAFELRVRLAQLYLQRGQPRAAATSLSPILQAPEEGPRGALFASQALTELARADWRGHLAAKEQATLEAWVRALAPPGAPTPAALPASTRNVSAGVTAYGERLSMRELDVLERIAAGDSNKLIARTFDLSPHTVKRHVANILGKLQLQTRGQAAAWYRAERTS